MLASLQNELISFGFSLLTLIAAAIVQARPRLVWAKTYGFAHSVKSNEASKPNLMVYTENILISNSGRRPATEVEVVFNYKPNNFALWEQREYSIQENPENRFIIKVPSLAAKEQFSINILMVGLEPPSVLKVRCAESSGKEIPSISVRLFPKWVYFMLYALIFLGMCAVFYVVVSAVEFFFHASG